MSSGLYFLISVLHLGVSVHTGEESGERRHETGTVGLRLPITGHQIAADEYPNLANAVALCRDVGVERRLTYGAVGERAILQLNMDAIKDVSWTYGGNHIATTEAGKDIQVRGDRYKGKLGTTPDGSLIINDLKQKDRGIYTASVRRNTPGGETCTIRYDLQVCKNISEDDIHIEHNVTSKEPCNMTFTCRVDRSHVNITWSSSAGSDINVIGHVLYVSAPDPSVVYTCTAQNCVSTSSKSVTPWDYHDGRTGDRNRAMIAIPCVAVIGILFATFTIIN
ncbi:SLAM family member 5-like [Mixophyes fleayi]|uniref:SLAM family member 5-like n=1 Tax=Mixophyes fleayi TaxID=3061075 RepID=UPI003F4DE10F